MCQAFCDFILFFNSCGFKFSKIVECHIACILWYILLGEEHIQGVASALARCEEPVLLIGVFGKNIVIGTRKIEAAELYLIL